MLKFLLDENIPKLVKKWLELKGFVVTYTIKTLSNSQFASEAKLKGCIILSRDKHFSDPNKFPPSEYAGIVVLKIHPPVAEKLIDGLSKLLTEVKEFKGRCFDVFEKRWEEVKEGV